MSELIKTNEETTQTTQGSEPWVVWVIRALAVMACFTPLVTYDLGLTPIFTKATYFRILVIFMAAIWLPLALTDKRYRPNPRNPLLITLTGYVALSLFMLPLSLNPARSLWSTSIRMTGTISLVYLWTWFVVLHSVQRRREHWKFLVWFLNLSAAVVSVIAIKEYLSGTTDRMSATLDNPIFLASFSTLCFWLAIWLFTTSKSKAAKLAAAAGAALQLAAVILSGTRASGLAILITGVLGVGLILWKLFTDDKKKWLLASIAAITATAVAWLKFAPTAIPPFLQRFTQASMGADRINLWLLALEGSMKKPFMGWGAENFEMVFDKFSEPTGMNWLNTASWNDRVHNQFLEVLVGQGSLGFVAYIAIWASALWFVLSSEARHNTPRAWSSSMALGLLMVAHAIQLCFSFDTPSAGIVFTLALALISANFWSEDEINKPTHEPPTLAIEAAIVMALFIAWYTNLQTLSQAATYRQGETLFLTGNASHFETFRESITESSPITADLRLKLVDLLTSTQDTQLYPPLEWKDITRLAAEETVKAADKNQLDFRLQLSAAEANRLFGLYKNDALHLSKRYAEQARNLAPQRVKAYEALGEAEMSMDELDEAIADFSQALRLTTYEMKIARLHFRLCEAHLKQGNPLAAVRDYRIARRMGYPIDIDIRLLTTLVESLEPGEVPHEFINYLERLNPLYDSRVSVLTAKAIIYAKAGIEDDARINVSKIRSRDTKIANDISPKIEQLLINATDN